MQQALGDGLEEICRPLCNQANYRMNICCARRRDNKTVAVASMPPSNSMVLPLQAKRTSRVKSQESNVIAMSVSRSAPALKNLPYVTDPVNVLSGIG